MLLLTSATDLVTVTNSVTGFTEVHASWVDSNAAGTTITPGRQNTPAITTAFVGATVVPGAASTYRNVKHLSICNDHGSATQVVSVEHTDGTNSETIFKATLLPGERAVMDEAGRWTVYTSGGIIKVAGPDTLFNYNTATQAFAAVDLYLTGSYLKFPSGGPKVGTKYKCFFCMTKTAGTGSIVVTPRLGVNGTTADASLGTLTLGPGTAVADTAWFELRVMWVAVGSGTTAVARAALNITALPTTGFSSTIKAAQFISAGHASTTADLGIGLSFNGSTAFAGNAILVATEIENF